MSIFHIAKLHYQRIIKNRSIIMIISILFLTSILGISMRIGFQDFIPLPSSDSLMTTFTIWNFGAILFCVFHAAGLFDSQVQHRYFVSTATKPIYFWEYQLGHFLSIFYVFLTISFLSILIMTIKALIYSTPFPNYFLLMMFNKWVDAGVIILIVLSLGFILKKTSALAFFFSIGILASIFSTIGDPPHPALQTLKYILYVITPIERVTDIHNAVEITTDDVLQSILESFGMILYAGTMMILSNVYYTKKDYPLRDS